jgi:hypothetical protein
MWLFGCIPLERGWDAGVGGSSSIQPKSKILFVTPLAGEAGQKNDSTELILKNLQTNVFHINILLI